VGHNGPFSHMSEEKLVLACSDGQTVSEVARGASINFQKCCILIKKIIAHSK